MFDLLSFLAGFAWGLVGGALARLVALRRATLTLREEIRRLRSPEPRELEDDFGLATAPALATDATLRRP